MAQQKLTRTDKMVVIQANTYMNELDLSKCNDQELDRLVSIININKNPLSWKAEDWQFINQLKAKPSGTGKGKFTGISAARTSTKARSGSFNQ